MFAIRLLGLEDPAGLLDCPERGGLVAAGFDPASLDETSRVPVADDPAGARAFRSKAEAIAFYLTASRRRPLRADGRPNRPLTAFAISLEPLVPAPRGPLRS